MQFVNPSILWALSALAIPILVHLFSFRRAKLIKFSNVRFLKEVKKKTASKKRLKHILIMISRLLFIFFLVMAFAQPFLPSQEDGLDSSAVTIYLDNSLSMSNPASDGTESLTKAINVAEEIINLYPPQTKFTLLTDGDPNRFGNLRTRDFVINDLLDLKYSNRSRNGQDILNQFSEGVVTQDIFLISDFQKSSFDNAHPIEDSINRYHVIPIKQTSQRNVSIDTIFLERPFVIKGQRNKLLVRLKNHDIEHRDDLIVKLIINNTEHASATIDVEAGQVRELKFELSSQLEATNQGLISFEDYPVRFDNESYFTINSTNTINIVEIKTSAEPSPFEMLFAKSDLFNLTSFRQGSLALNTLEKADLVIINTLPKLDNGLLGQLTSMIDQGKTMILIPSENGDYTALSDKLNLGMTKSAVADTLEFTVRDGSHPFYQNIFEKIDDKSVQPRGQFLWQWSVDDDVLLNSQSNKAYLSRVGKSRNIYLLAGPITKPYANFNRNALFVPIFQRIAELSAHAGQPLYYTLDDSHISQSLDSTDNTKGLFKLVNEKAELIPDQRQVGNRLLLNLPNELISTGYYDLIQENTITNSLAFNHQVRESRLEQLEDNELKGLFSKAAYADIYDIEERADITRKMKEKYERFELWKYALLLSLLFLIVEGLLIRFL